MSFRDTECHPLLVVTVTSVGDSWDSSALSASLLSVPWQAVTLSFLLLELLLVSLIFKGEK